MPFSIPVSVIFTLSKYPKVLCKLSSKYKSYPKVNPLVAVDKVVVGWDGVGWWCLGVVGLYTTPDHGLELVVAMSS